MSPSKLRNVLRSTPVRVLAEKLGVSERTINRYRKAGKVPQKHAERLEKFREWDVRPPNRKLKKALALDVDILASFAGVTKRTARRWQKLGAIPKRSQGFLVTREVEATPRRLRTRVENYSGKFTRGRIYKTDINAIVGDDLRLLLLSWVSNIRKSPNKRAMYHMVADGRAFIDPKTEMVGSSKVVFPDKKGHYGEVDVVFPGTNEYSMRDAVMSFCEEVEEQSHLTIFLKTVTLYIRTPA